MSGLLPHFLTALLYGALGAYFWRTQWGPAVTAAPAEPAPRPVWPRLAVALPFALHSLVLYQSIFAGDAMNLGLANAVSAIAWLTVLVYWSANLFENLEGLQPLVLPAAALLALLPGLYPAQHPVPNANLLAFKLHLVVSMLTYSLFTIAALHALLMAVLEKRLHARGAGMMRHRLPPLLTMEQLLFRILGAAFILLTLTLLTGSVFSEELFGKPFAFSHKTVFALLSWATFAALLGGRIIYGWRGRMAVRFTLAGFVLLLLAYVGTRFVLQVLLHRA